MVTMKRINYAFWFLQFWHSCNLPKSNILDTATCLSGESTRKPLYWFRVQSYSSSLWTVIWYFLYTASGEGVTFPRASAAGFTNLIWQIQTIKTVDKTAYNRYLCKRWFDKKPCVLAFWWLFWRVVVNCRLIFMVNLVTFRKMTVKDFTSRAWAN